MVTTAIAVSYSVRNRRTLVDIDRGCDQILVPVTVTALPKQRPWRRSLNRARVVTSLKVQRKVYHLRRPQHAQFAIFSWLSTDRSRTPHGRGFRASLEA